MTNRKNRSQKKNRSRKNRARATKRGGGLGAGFGFSADPALKETSNNPVSWQSIGNCRQEARPGFLAGGFTGSKGLPGMSGGKRSSRRSSRRTSRRTSRRNSKRSSKRSSKRICRKQRGGRFAADFTPEVYGPQGGLMPVQSIPCEASRVPIPPPTASGVLNTRNSYLWSGSKGTPGDIPVQFGGADQTVDASSASPYVSVPRAHYTQLEKPDEIIKTAAGTNLMINKPYNNAEWNTTCTKPLSGGRRSNSRKNKKNSRKNKKSRK